MPSSENNPVDIYFMDARSKLLDIAAFMDRVERSGGTEDYRYQAFIRSLSDLNSSGRTENILKRLSDPTTEPTPEASPGPATGAWLKTD